MHNSASRPRSIAISERRPDSAALGPQETRGVVESFLLKDVQVVVPGSGVANGDVLVRNGRIAAMGAVRDPDVDASHCIEGRGRLLTPGMVDIHTHGILRHLYARGRSEFLAGAACLAQFGVTTVVPTIVPQISPRWLDKISEVAAALPDVRGVNVPGLHLEGPFLAIKGSAAETLAGDVGLLDEILSACRGLLSVMSVSPEVPNILPVIRRLRENHTKVFITHTRASAEQTDAAFAAGAIHATHFYDVFPPPAEADPGVRPVGAVEAVLANRKVSVDFICDGIHVHPAAIRAAVAAKGYRGVILITDSIVGAGLPSGVYDTPWGFQVRLRDGDASRHATKNILAGSALTMDRGISNLLKWLDLPREQVWAMATRNPAELLGLEETATLETGSHADLVLWDEAGHPAQTWVRGQSAYLRDAPQEIPTL